MVAEEEEEEEPLLPSDIDQGTLNTRYADILSRPSASFPKTGESGNRQRPIYDGVANMRAAAWMFGVLSAIGTALALASVVQRVFRVELAPLLESTLGAYRAFISPVRWVMQALASLIHFDVPIPQWYVDATALSFIGFLILMRAIEPLTDGSFIGEPDDPFEDLPPTAKGCMQFGMAAALSVTLLGCIYSFFFAFWFLFTSLLSWRDRKFSRRLRNMGLEIVAGYAGCAAFFVLDAALT